MKSLLIIPISALIFACGSQKELTDNTSKEETTETAQTNYRIIGIVHTDDAACGVYIDATTEPGVNQKLYPVNLDEKFKQDGTKIKFDYNISRAMNPKGCKVDMTVSVSDVTRMRN